MSLNRILNVDVLKGLKTLPDNSVDCVMTSPPYWALRSYGTEPQIWGGIENHQHEWGEVLPAAIEKHVNEGRQIIGGKGSGAGNIAEQHPKNSGSFCQLCGAWRGELGLEPTFQLYLNHLLGIFDEVKRVLKPSGTCFVNMGDTFASQPAGNKEIRFEGDGVYGRLMKRHTDGGKADVTPKPKNYGLIREKSLCMLPYRFAIGMTERGWILRNVIIWNKRNCMPSSVKDRFMVDFEPLFFFSKSRKYFFDINAIRERTGNEANEEDYFNADGRRHFHQADLEKGMLQYNPDFRPMTHPSGRAPRAVWAINTQPFAADHFAKYPEELCRRPILAGCPELVCNACGKPREKVYKTSYVVDGGKAKGSKYNALKGFDKAQQASSEKMRLGRALISSIETVGFSDCGCNAGFSAGVVLDPFAGVGTTLKVAKKYGRSYIGFEIKKEYCEIAETYLAGADNSVLRDMKHNKKLVEVIQNA